jgi:hypothetical protein
VCNVAPYLGVAGLGLDIAGALILGSSIVNRPAAQIAAEAPKQVSGMMAEIGGPISLTDDLAQSLVRQKGDAWLGLIVFGIGFLLQAAVYLFSGHRLSGAVQILAAYGGTAALVLLVLFVVRPRWRHWYYEREWPKVDAERRR